MVDRAIDDKSSNTLVVVSGEGFWTGSSTLPHLHHFLAGTGEPCGGGGRCTDPPDGASAQPKCDRGRVTVLNFAQPSAIFYV